MNLVEERKSWYKLFEDGYVPKLIKDNKEVNETHIHQYMLIKDSNLSRMSRLMEQACAYKMWRESK